MGTRVEYVALAVAVTLNSLLVAAVVLLMLMLVLDVRLVVVLLHWLVIDVDDAVVLHWDFPIPTQYASPTQKLVWQSDETDGFHERNCCEVMLNCCCRL